MECRAVVIRRATWWGRAAGVISAIILGTWILLAIRPEQFLVVWLVLVALVYLFVSTLVRRVAFAVIRERGVSLPEEVRA